MLNFTVGLANLRSACNTARITTILTARAFIRQAKLEETVAALEGDGKRFLYLEDISATIGGGEQLRAALTAQCAAARHARIAALPRMRRR